jgi:CRP/FNR family transcriptional regulator, nitrogen oxide reductase regulator
MHSSWSEHPAGEMLFLQGSPAKEFFLLESGLVRLHELTTEGDDVLVHLITPGKVFGCFALTSRPNPASAEVVFPSRVLKWSSRTILDLLSEIPQAAVNLIDIALDHVVHFHERARRFERDSVSERVRWALANLTSAAGKKTRQGMVIEYAGSHRILAQLAGTNIYSVSRELCKLEREGMLSKERGRIFVPDLDNLDCQ